MTESMSILAAPTTQMADHPLLMFLAVLLFIGPVVSVAIGKMIGVFRHPGIVGPDRLEETESPLALFGMLLFAIVGYILVSGLYARAVAGVAYCDRNLFAGDANALYRFWNSRARS